MVFIVFVTGMTVDLVISLFRHGGVFTPSFSWHSKINLSLNRLLLYYYK